MEQETQWREFAVLTLERARFGFSPLPMTEMDARKFCDEHPTATLMTRMVTYSPWVEKVGFALQ